MSENSSKARFIGKKSRCSFVFSFFLLFSLPHVSGSILQAQEHGSLIDDFLQNLQKNFDSFQGIKTYLELELFQPGIPQHRSFAQLAYVSKDEKLYFKTFSSLTPHHFTLISRGGSFWLQIPKMRTIYTGPLEAIGQENFELKITPQDILKLLVPNPIDKTTPDVRLEEQPLYWILSTYRQIGQQPFKEREIWIQKNRLQVVRDTRFSVQGRPFLEIRWEDFETRGENVFPRLITMSKPLTGYTLRFKIKKWEKTGEIPEKLFQLADREGFEVESVGP